MYWYVRIKGRRVARLPDDPESPEYFEAYATALRKHADDPKPRTQEDGTVGWLITSYKASQEYRGLSPKTQVSYARELDRMETIDSFQATDIRRRHIRAIRDTLASTPRTQQLFGQVCSLLFNFGIRELDLDMVNPAARLRRSDDPDSFLAWTEEQMQAFEASEPLVELMTAYMVGRYTGPRRGDITDLKRSHWDGHSLSIAGAKTGNRITVPAHHRLRDYLNALPATLTIIADAQGRPVTPDQLSKRLRAHLDTLGFTDLHLHGLRHTSGRELAECGCSSKEIAAVLGHKTLQMVERYTKKADQEALASAAIVKLEQKRNSNEPNRGQ